MAESRLQSIKNGYLLLYNVWCAAGWAIVLNVVFWTVVEKRPAMDAYHDCGFMLKWVQTMAVMEVVHAVVGLVRSPWFTTLVQVLSRLLVVWCFIEQCPASREGYGFLLCAGSWAAVEVPRYLFYAGNLLGGVPEPFFLLRYSLFAVLYPTGITGEILCILAALPCHKAHKGPEEWPLMYYHLSLFALTLYIPGSPYMYMHMVKTRKMQIRKRKEADRAEAAAAMAAAAGAKGKPAAGLAAAKKKD